MEQQLKAKSRRWTQEEDEKLTQYVNTHGKGQWRIVAQNLGIGKSGSSCRQRWYDHLSPELVRGDFTEEERVKILTLHSEWGKKWARIARELPGRTDNAVKNFCLKHLAKQKTQATAAASELFPPPAGREFIRLGDSTVDVSNWPFGNLQGGGGVTSGELEWFDGPNVDVSNWPFGSGVTSGELEWFYGHNVDVSWPADQPFGNQQGGGGGGGTSGEFSWIYSPNVQQFGNCGGGVTSRELEWFDGPNVDVSNWPFGSGVPSGELECFHGHNVDVSWPADQPFDWIDCPDVSRGANQTISGNSGGGSGVTLDWPS